MIGESAIDLFFGIMGVLFSGFELIKLPTELIGTLSTILSYGVWVVGLDIMALFVSSVVIWWGVHLSIGIALWVWRLLPLT